VTRQKPALLFSSYKHPRIRMMEELISAEWKALQKLWRDISKKGKPLNRHSEFQRRSYNPVSGHSDFKMASYRPVERHSDFQMAPYRPVERHSDFQMASYSLKINHLSINSLKSYLS